MDCKPKRRTRDRILATALAQFNLLGEPTVTTSAIAIDKELTKQALVPHGIPMPGGRIVDSALRQWLGDDVADDFDLAVQPAVIEHQFGDVFNEQAQQSEQAAAQFGLVFGQQLQLEGKALEAGEEFL